MAQHILQREQYATVRTTPKHELVQVVVAFHFKLSVKQRCVTFPVTDEWQKYDRCDLNLD